MIIASLNKDILIQNSSTNTQTNTQPIFVTSLTSSKNEPILTSSPNSTLCNKPSTNTSNQLQLINLNKITKATSCNQPIKTINLMNSSPVLLTTKLNKSNLLTTIDKVEIKQDNDFQEDNFLSSISEFDSNSSNMLDDSLTSLQWLQSLNLMKNGVATASSCSLSPNSQTSDKSQNSLDCDLDSATIPAVNTLPKDTININKSTSFSIQYPPLSPPLSVQCSTSPQSTCSSIASTKKRTKKINEQKTVQQQLQHQNSAPAVLQTNNKSPSPVSTPISNPSSIFRNTSSYFKDREEYRTNSHVKPPYSYSQLIILSMKESKQSKMTLQMIYDWIIGNFSYFKKADPTWQVTFKNSIRHNLSLNKCFRKIARQKDEPGKGGFWTLDPDFERQLDESNFLGPVNQKSQKRKRKNCDEDDDAKKPKTEFVQFNDLDNNNLLRSDANWSQENKNLYQENNQYNFNYSNQYYYNYPVQYQQQQQQQQPQQQQQQHRQQQHHHNNHHQQTVQQHQQHEHQQSISQIDISETFSNSFSNEIIKTLDEDTSLFNFEPGLVNFDIDQLTTDSSCTSNSTPDDLVNEYLKKSSNFTTSQASDHNELIELFDITSQFNLDENLSASHMINPSIEKKSIDLTVQGHSIKQPKWWMESILGDLDTGFINGTQQQHQTQDDECDSAMFINSQNSLDLGLSVDDLDFLNVDSNKETKQQAKKRIYTHQNKLNPAIHKTIRAKTQDKN